MNSMQVLPTGNEIRRSTVERDRLARMRNCTSYTGNGMHWRTAALPIRRNQIPMHEVVLRNSLQVFNLLMEPGTLAEELSGERPI